MTGEQRRGKAAAVEQQSADSMQPESLRRAPAPRLGEAGVSGRPVKILIVDDNPDDRMIYRRLLAKGVEDEWVFWEAETGEEALEVCRSKEPDCILLDYLLPDTDGLQFLTELADLKAHTIIPVVMITGCGSESVAVQAIKGGAQEYVAKGTFTREIIRRAVSNAIQKVALLRKITQQRSELEDTNEELETLNSSLYEASQLKSEFLANASHELRTPLNSMLGFLRLVLDGMCETPEEERDFIRTAYKSAEGLLDLINDLLDVSKIEAGKMGLDLEPVDVEHLFNDVYLLTHMEAQQRSLKLELHPLKDSDITLRADYGKLKQILLNLVSNALKFTESGRVTVRAIPALERGFVSIHVEDTGIGVRSELQGKLFEKFVQADGSVTRKYGGTGLGLTIAKNLVELMGGVINFQSEGVGKGAQVSFTVPVHRQDDLTSANWHAAAGEGATIKGDPQKPLVLIAEDDVHYRTMLEEMAHQAGYSTAYALTADDAVMMARKMAPAAITLDHGLLVREHAALMDGWDAYKALRADIKTAHIPVIFISGYDAHVQERLEEMPAGQPPRLIMKPFDCDEFRSVLEEAAGPGEE